MKTKLIGSTEAPVQGYCMANKVNCLHVQAVGVKKLFHGHPGQVIALEGFGVLGVILLHIPASQRLQFSADLMAELSAPLWTKRNPSQTSA